ncbi:Transmembrane protein [Phytophthora megakarya]|uniref:Transmembrane protein n=1 Tax=Phytophthora megakarya TaxID=4795 RepID=A0A225VR00_9STRA|nr:Transmembrane protein [Phytophthora megakarya]
MQREAQRKVEAFFQRTYEKNTNDIDEREIQRWPTRKTRARTTVNRSVGNMQDNEAKVIDLKNLRNGGKHPGWHLENDEPLTPQYEENSTKQVAMAMTVGTSSTGTTATRSMPSDHVPMAPNYVISPQAEVIKPKVLAKKKSQTAKAIVGGHRADNVSLTPTLPRLSASESSMLTPSPFVSSLATPTGFGESGATLRSPAKSPVAFATTASGFTWKAGNVFKRSTIDGLGTSQFSQRSTLAGRVQSLSASLASTLRRMLQGKDAQRQDTNRGVTSPQSQCTAPAALPRAYDQNGFYEAPFKVPGLNKPLGQRQKKIVESDRAWTRQWLILATCAVLGLSLGAILVRVVSYNSSVFNLSADEVHELQKSNGELVLAAGVRWMLLPGNLFLRVWSVVTTLLLFCYVSTSLTDLVGCADKSTLVLSYRSIGYTLLLAILAACEGILAMWITHSFGWFRGYNETIVATASALSNAIGVTPLPDGAVGLVCSEYGEYLQDLGHNVFACSNASLALPLYEEVSTNSSGITGSGPAVFALHEVTDVLATPTPSIPYYPDSLGSGWKMTTSLLSRLTPDNVIAQFTRVDFDEMASLGGLIVFGLLLGYVCGKRILTLRRDAQAAMFETAQSSVPDPHKSRHYIIGILMELQLALEWLIRPIERYLAPLGFFSLMLGNVVLHHREWRSFTSPMASLIVGVTFVLFLHAILILPIVLRLLSSSRRRLPLLTTMRAFTPAFIFAFITDNLALSAPITMQCYARVHTVTRSGAQLTTAVTAPLIRNARALYLPLLVLWLLETSSSEKLVLSPSDYISVGLLSLVSSFCGGNTRLTMAITRTLWSIAMSDVSSASNLLPPTMSLLVVCDVALSRIASVVSVADHLVLTHLVSQHWDETVVQGVANVHVDEVPSPSPLDDSQAPRPSSSAMLSSVYL